MATTQSTSYVSAAWREGLFENRVVFCTGGSGDLCSAQVRALVCLGANACIVGRNKDKAERVAADIATARPGAKVLGYGAVDVRSVKDLEGAVENCVRELGGIDFVIAGAAGNFLAPFTQVSTNAFKTVVDIDLMGSWNTVKAALPRLLESVSRYGDTGGRIIFISATLGYTGVQLNTHGVVAKAGVDALSAQLAIELGPRGIRSNVIAPGPIDGTEGMKRLSSLDDARVVKRIPIGRLGTRRNIADATVYLFSDTGDYVNGAVLVVDGGAWRTSSGEIGTGFAYPDFLLSDEPVGESKGNRRSKI